MKGRAFKKKLFHDPVEIRQSLLDKTGIFGDLKIESDLYKHDLKMLNNLSERFDKEKSSDKSKTDRKELLSFRRFLASFYDYLKQQRTAFNDQEKKEFSEIIRPDVPLISKQRRLETLFHNVKERVEFQKKLHKERKKIEKEIEVYKDKPLFFMKWFRLTYFAWKYGTISFLKHDLSDDSLIHIRKTLLEKLSVIAGYIEEILDDDYEKFTNEEYNFLIYLFRLKEPALEISEIAYRQYYPRAVLIQPLTHFAGIFYKLIYNRKIAEKALSKAFDMSEVPERLKNHVMKILEHPDQTVRGHRERIKHTVSGTLYSFFSSYLKNIVETPAQLVYALKIDTSIEIQTKLLTEKAMENERRRFEKMREEEAGLLEHYRNINRIVQSFPEIGEEVFETIFLHHDKPLPAERDYTQNRGYYTALMLEYYLFYYGSGILNDGNEFKVHYNADIFEHYFSAAKELRHLLRGLKKNSEFLETCDFQAVMKRREVDEDLLEMIRRDLYACGRILAEHIKVVYDLNEDYKKDSPGVQYDSVAFKNFRDPLKQGEPLFSERNVIDQVPADHKNYKDIVFLTDSYLSGASADRLGHLFLKERISLFHFIEQASGAAYYLSKKMGFPQFAQLSREKMRLKKLYDKVHERIKIELNPSAYGDSEIEEIRQNNRALQDEIEELYHDELTGLANRHFLNNRILPVFYNDEKKYNGIEERYVFFADIDHFKTFNNNYGHDAGDLALKKAAAVFNRIVSPVDDLKNIVLKAGGAEIMGFISGYSFKDVLKKLNSIREEFKNTQINYGGKKLSGLNISIGVYREFPGSVQSWNMKIADSLMYYAKERGGGRVAFIKDPGMEIQKKHFDEHGNLDINLTETVSAV